VLGDLGARANRVLSDQLLYAFEFLQSRVWFWKRLSRSSFPFVNTGAGAPDTTLAVKPFH
jgi:hypothetical protein